MRDMVEKRAESEHRVNGEQIAHEFLHCHPIFPPFIQWFRGLVHKLFDLPLICGVSSLSSISFSPWASLFRRFHILEILPRPERAIACWLFARLHLALLRVFVRIGVLESANLSCGCHGAVRQCRNHEVVDHCVFLALSLSPSVIKPDRLSTLLLRGSLPRIIFAEPFF